MHTSLSSSRKHLQQEVNFLRAAAAVRAELQNAMEPSPPDPRTTKGITHEQRYHLCLKKQDCPTMKQSELAAWFLETYSFSISQPTISHSLKKSVEIIARGISTPGLEPTRVRRRPVRHPELELALFQWVQQQQEQQQEQVRGQEQSGDGLDPISGPALVRQAKKIAQEMNIHDTVFCPGWLSRFKMRYGITPSRGSSQPGNHHRHHHLNYAHHSHDPYPHQRRHRHHQLPEQQQPQQQLQQPQQQPQAEFEAPIQTVSSITISNHSCSPPPSEDYPMPQTDTVTPRSTFDSSALGTIEIRPSIAVPASINSSHSSLQQLRPPHTGFGTVHILPSSGDLDRQSLHQQRQQHLQQQQQQQQQQDAQLLQQFRMQTYQPATSHSIHLHPHNQQRQQHQQTLTDFQAVSGGAPSSPSVATSASEITAAMHLEFIQSIPITASTNGTGSLLHAPSSLPSSSLSHHTPGSLLRSPNDPFQSSIVARTDAVTSSSSSTGRSKLDSGFTQGKVQTLQEAQRLVQLLRQYAGSNLQDPTGALKSLESLEWELDPTKMRGSITISEVGDDQD